MSANTKNVELELHTTIDDHGQIETNTTKETGRLYVRENMDVLTYDDTLEDGSVVHNMLKIQSGRVSIKRSGTVSMHQQFDLSRMTENVFQHPHGNLHMLTTTRSIDYQPLNGSKRGLLKIYYTVQLNGQDERKHTLTLSLKEEAHA